MKEKLLRYATLKELLETRQISKLEQIFDHVPYHQVAFDLQMDEARLRKIITDTREMKIGDIFNLAGLIGCSEDIIMNMAADQFLAGKNQ